MEKLFVAGLVLGFSLFGSGCVVGRRAVDLPIPTATSLPASKGTVAIGSIADARHFENEPSDPWTPSIDGDVNSQSAAQLSAFIGRQRNTYGHAMGDVALPPGETVQARVKELITQGFARRGYTITTDISADNAVDVKINEFWAWVAPEFVYISFEARVYCSFAVKRGGRTRNFTVQGYGSNPGQVVRDANWQLAYTRAFEDFLGKFDQELANDGF